MHYFSALFALLISLACFLMSFKLIRLYMRVRKWKRMDATVVSKEIKKHEKYSASRAPWGIRAEYDYVVENTAFKGHRVYLVELIGGQANHMESDAKKRLSAIKDKMKIYVDPADPSRSVMFCNGISLYIFIFCAGILSFLIGLSMFLS